MNIKKSLRAMTAALLCAGVLTACASSDGSGDTTETTANTTAKETTTTEKSTTAPEPSDSGNVRITALSGPTAIGMTKLMDDSESKKYPYDFNIVAAVDEISPAVTKGETDIFCVPANLASVLYNKTEGGVKVLAVNTLGVIYICENGDTVKDISDLRGKTLYASGKSATPEYALNYILSENGIDPEKDLTIEWKSEHAECVAALLADENGVAMIPQPFVTVAQSQNEGINVVLDLTEEWDKLDNGSAMITGVVAVRSEYAEKNPDVIKEFLTRYANSVDYVNSNVVEAAKLVEKYGITKAAVAEKAIPECNIVCVTAEEMKEKLSGYLDVLFEQVPQAVGGAVPEDDFYYNAEENGGEPESSETAAAEGTNTTEQSTAAGNTGDNTTAAENTTAAQSSAAEQTTAESSGTEQSNDVGFMIEFE